MSELDQQLFNRAYGMKQRLRTIHQAFGPMRDRSALCIGAVPATLRIRLMALGGDWTFSETRGELPYKDGSFDRVAVLGHLESVADDYEFMADVHRVLKTAGMLFVDAEHAKRWTVWRPVRRLFGVEDHLIERVREGYTERGLFDILKDGFDIQETRTYSRFFTESIETIQRLAVGSFAGTEPDADAPEDEIEAETRQKRLHIIQSVAYPLFVLAAQLDWLVIFTKGYRMRAVARRRLWKPRRTPVLRDGRTLADATLNTKIGTAAPF